METISLRARSCSWSCVSLRWSGGTRRTKIEARLGVFVWLSPIVTFVAVTSLHSRTSRAMRSAESSVDARLVPSGVRTLISNWASSFLGKKPFCTFLTRGTHDPSVANAATTTIQRRSTT